MPGQMRASHEALGAGATPISAAERYAGLAKDPPRRIAEHHVNPDSRA